MPAGSAPAKVPQADLRSGTDAGLATGPVGIPAESGPTNVGEHAPDLVPTTLRIMGNVVYLHAPSGKLLMDVGNLSSPGRGMKLDLCAIAATADEAVESADFRASGRRKQRGK
jgi:hypothetical protein